MLIRFIISLVKLKKTDKADTELRTQRKKETISSGMSALIFIVGVFFIIHLITIAILRNM